MTKKLIQPEELSSATTIVNRSLKELDKILLGNSSLHKMVLIGIFSQGHILLEGLPGVGKTALVKALGQLLGLGFGRVQFTPDLMPSDILGTNILQENEAGIKEMIFRQGPVFTNILLADEINRASPKTQSAMLEAMQEGTVTLLGKTRDLPFPFFVLASQNPIEMEGTYPIPEAQLDRFMFKLNVTTHNSEILSTIISNRRRGIPPKPESVLTEDNIKEVFEVMEQIHLPHAVADYIGRLVAASHPMSQESSADIKKYVSYGASPRAAIALAEASRAAAIFAGRPSVSFDDVNEVVPAVLNHRIILNYKANMDNVDVTMLLEKLLNSVEEVELDLPQGVSVS